VAGWLVVVTGYLMGPASLCLDREKLLGYAKVLEPLLALGKDHAVSHVHRFCNATALGTKPFEHRGKDKVIFKMTLRALPLILLTFGVYYFWYMAKLSRYQTENTWFDGARSELEIPGGEIFQLVLLQILALTFSLGLAFPWVTTYSLRFYLARMRLVGPIRFAQIYQADAQGDASADGLADARNALVARVRDGSPDRTFGQDLQLLVVVEHRPGTRRALAYAARRPSPWCHDRSGTASR
jgi:Bacterial protein of unknown function (DUF898)